MGTTIGIWLLKNQIGAAKKGSSKNRPKRTNEPLTRGELDIVFMRYFEGLRNPEVDETDEKAVSNFLQPFYTYPSRSI
jgi:hypothetical protein